MSVAEELIPPQPAPPVSAFRWTRLRILGATLLGLWIAAGIALVLWLVDAWDIDKVTTYGPKFLSGLATTLTLVGISIALGAVLSVPIEPHTFLDRLRLCLLLPRHAADRTAVPDLLRLRQLPR